MMAEQDNVQASTAPADRGWLGLIDDFVRNLGELPRGALAKLARGSRATSGQAFGAFYKALPYQLAKHEDALLIAAMAYSICKGGKHFAGSFGKTARVVKMNGGYGSLDRRFTTLLDSNIDNGELEYRLIQMVRMAKSKDIGIDWKQLAIDLIDWNRDEESMPRASGGGSPVQKRWALDYFGTRPVDPDEKE